MSPVIVSRRGFTATLAALLPVPLLARVRSGVTTSIQDPGISHSAEAIHQEVSYKAPPPRVYEALLDDKQFAKVTGQATILDRAEGGAFSLFGARIKGRNVELVSNQRIVQAWRSEGWESGVYSIVRFELKAEGTGTRLVFDHAGFPVGQADHLASGWKSNYWDPLTRFLGA